MLCVQWNADSDRDGCEYAYFTRGDRPRQLAEASAFARSLRIDPRKGYVTIKDPNTVTPLHPELRS